MFEKQYVKPEVISLKIEFILSLVVIYQMNLLAFWHLLLVGFVIQSLGCFYNPAYRAILPLITPLANRTTVNSLLDIVTRGVQVLGPIFSIGLLSSGNTIHFYTLNALTYLVSAFFILKLNWPDTNNELNTTESEKNSIFSSIRDFFSWVKGEYTIKTLFMVTFLMVFFNTWVWQVGLLLLLLETSSNGKELYSLLLGWYGAAVIAVNLLIPFVWKKMSLSTYLYGSIVWGAGIFLLGFASNLSIYFLGVLITAIGLPITGLTRVYLIQTLIPANKLGRAFSLNAVILYGANVISLILFGALSSFFEIRYIFMFCGGLMILCSFFYLYRIFSPARTGRESIQAFK